MQIYSLHKNIDTLCSLAIARKNGDLVSMPSRLSSKNTTKWSHNEAFL